MNATIRPEQTEATEEVDNNLAAVTEVEAGIRDFVRNDIAYLRRPAVEPGNRAARPQRRSHRQQRQLADPARRRNLACGNREADFRTRKPARPPACRRPARSARNLRLCAAQPGRDEIDAHDRRQRHAVEARRRRTAQQLIVSRDRHRCKNLTLRRLPCRSAAVSFGRDRVRTL